MSKGIGRGSRRRPATGLRYWRGKLDLSQTVIAGNPGVASIVYGYGFPSKPGRIKIGYSSRGLSRIVEQSTGFPEKPVVHFLIHDAKARDIEAALHGALAERQADTLGVEWFDVGIEDVIAVSSHLSRALGREHGRRIRLALASASFFLVWMLFWPPLFAALSHIVSEGFAPTGIMSGVRYFRDYVFEGLFDRSWMTSAYRFASAEAGRIGAFWLLAGVSIAPGVVFAALPWRWRKRRA